MNAPYFVKLPSGMYVNLSQVTYVSRDRVQFGFSSSSYTSSYVDIEGDDAAALRAWLDKSAVDLSAPVPLNEGMTMMVNAARRLIASDGQDSADARALAEMVLDQFDA